MNSCLFYLTFQLFDKAPWKSNPGHTPLTPVRYLIIKSYDAFTVVFPLSVSAAGICWDLTLNILEARKGTRNSSWDGDLLPYMDETF